MKDKNNKWIKSLPELLILVLCMAFLSLGISQKEGYHMDELLSFELSNARYNPWIVPTQPEGRLAKFVREEIQGDSFSETVEKLMVVLQDVAENRGNSKLLSYKADVYEEPVWISSEQFWDYITVDSQDAFDYLSVYFNVKDDNHPPVHFLLLHTMSSLFRGQIDPWLGCSINLVCSGVVLLLLMWMGRRLAPELGLAEQGRALGMLAAITYGLSTGALATVLLIRMYGLLSCFCVALLAIHVKKWQDQTFDRNNKALIAVTVLGFLTQYFFLFYCILLAAVTAILLWQKGRRRELWCYLRSMVLAAGIGLVCFPFAVSDVLSSGRGTEALGNLAAGLSGYGERLLSFFHILGNRTIGIVPLVLLLLLGVLGLMWSARRGAGRETCVIWLLVLPALGYFLLAARMSPYLVDRYVMPCFPLLSLLLAVVMLRVAVWLEAYLPAWGKRCCVPVVCAVLLLCQLWQLVCYDGEYLYRGYGRQEAVAEEYAGYPCICVYDGVGYYENLLEFTCYEKTLLVQEQELSDRQDTASLEELQEAVVLIKRNVDKQRVFDLLKDKYGLICSRELLQGGVYGDSLYLAVRQ